MKIRPIKLSPEEQEASLKKLIKQAKRNLKKIRESELKSKNMPGSETLYGIAV